MCILLSFIVFLKTLYFFIYEFHCRFLFKKQGMARVLYANNFLVVDDKSLKKLFTADGSTIESFSD